MRIKWADPCETEQWSTHSKHLISVGNYSSKFRNLHGANSYQQAWLKCLLFPIDLFKASYFPFALWVSCFWNPELLCVSFFFFLMCMCVLLFFNINLFNWRLITILYWFCHISTWIRHGYTRVPHPEPPSHFPPHTIPLVIPVHQPQASCFMHRTWTGDSFEWQQGYSPLSKHS